MPVGIQRLNARHSQPNPHIVFIKPLKGPDEDVARQFLERIAAQCVPIMRRHHISVMTLEEYEPNAEFVGRNFNAGEVIQLVLKTRGPRRGPRQWLPFAYVQMVMMHELAHCKQMNHARAFWAVRNAYAAEMRALWAARYTGEGIWGRGAVLGSAGGGGTPVYERDVVANDDEALLVDHLCGGTFRSRGGRRRKRKETLTYREREDRRVKRKFGVNGVALGDDLEERARLEAAKPPDGGGSGSSTLRQTRIDAPSTTTATATAKAPAKKMTKAEQKRLATKPRVAGSKRGRELRAAAALARFDQAKKKEKEEEEMEADDYNSEVSAIKREEDVADDDDNDDDDDDEYDDDGDLDVAGPDAVDIDGSRLLDGQGRAMVRVCEGMDDGGGGGGGGADGPDDARRELLELVQSAGWGVKDEPGRVKSERVKDERREVSLADIPTAASATSGANKQAAPVKKEATTTKRPPPSKTERPAASLADIPLRSAPATTTASTGCGVCSYANKDQAITCAVCGHVLHADAVVDAWHCESTACRPAPGTVRYLNAGDCGVCGACGQRRP